MVAAEGRAAGAAEGRTAAAVAVAAGWAVDELCSFDSVLLILPEAARLTLLFLSFRQMRMSAAKDIKKDSSSFGAAGSVFK